MNNIIAIFKKQLKDTFKNKTVLIQFVMFPVLTIIMNNTIKIDGMPENFFVTLFATMYIGMAPLTSMTAVISEEKEKNTLRVLMMSDVKPYEYLVGTGSYILAACMAGAVVICITGSYSLQESFIFIAVMAAGIIVSLLTGATIGIFSKTQMMATSVSVPVMMVFAFMPMLSMFNTTLAKFSKLIYPGQINIMLKQISSLQLEISNICIIASNLFIFTALFTIAYKKCGLE